MQKRYFGSTEADARSSTLNACGRCRFVPQGQAAWPRCWFVQSRRRSVMKTLSAVLALAVAVMVWAVPRATADAKAEQQAVGVVLVERIQDLNLTDKQEAKIADIRKEYRPKVQEAGKELAAIVKE